MKQLIHISAVLAVFIAGLSSQNAAGAARLMLSITSPKSGQRVTNEQFAATGKASGGAGVSNVWIRLNTGSWTLATDTTNWTATLDLQPGTNALLAYAEGSAGNHSATGKVSFFYVLEAMMTVQTNGYGVVTPNYDGKPLEIGRSYAMTAKAGKGYAFDNWGGSIPTNKPTLKFLMATNLNCVANFKDVKRPVCIVQYPAVNQKLTNTVITATGKASDNTGVSNVWYQLNSGGWILADLAGNGTNWTTPDLSPTPGSNLFQALAVDAAGNTSRTNSVKFFRVASPDSLAGVNITARTASGTALLSFGTNTFSQTGGSAHHNVGVGSYTYAKTGPASGECFLTYDAPPTMTNSTPDIRIIFTQPNAGWFTNVDVSMEAYAFTLKSATQLAPESLSGKVVRVVISGGQTGTLTLNTDATFTVSSSTGKVEFGTYSYQLYSPAAGMLTLTFEDAGSVGGMNYIQMTFTTSASGTFINTLYRSDGSFKRIDTGTFKVR